MRRWLPLHVACFLLAALLAGCSHPPSGTGSTSTQVVVDASGRAIVLDPASNKTVETPHGAVAENRAIVYGRVHDSANLSVSGATLGILGTPLTGRSGADGSFKFAQVPVGTFKVRVEASGFLALEQEFTTQAGKETLLDLTLKVNALLGAGYAPHIHDFWGRATERVLMEEVVPVYDDLPGGSAPQSRPGMGASPAATTGPCTKSLGRSNFACPWEFFLPDSPDQLPQTIWPGTKTVTFKLSWESSPENNLPKVGILLRHAALATAKPDIDLGAVASGGTLTYEVPSSNQTDNGHQLFTAWVFRLYVANDLEGSTTSWTPAVGRAGVGVKISIFKGAIGLDPPHRDFWGANASAVVGDPDHAYNAGAAAPQEASSTDSQHVFGIASGPKGGLNIIPPGTKKLDIKITWSYKATTNALPDLGLKYKFTYRTADQYPKTTLASDYKVPKLLESGPSMLRYEVPTSPTEWDGFYQEKSFWGLRWAEDDSLPYHEGYLTQFKIVITAVKDPSF
ncbi:MAG TPA: carboxypeptidase-like regulatory domain-containing protein [Candidatus Thermoplasmatota archaeon]|nr:carboxypeptidase-like regulatory domain-containing protein [Candidatus Thermoplasmatota archaeon]